MSSALLIFEAAARAALFGQPEIVADRTSLPQTHALCSTRRR
ncbi:hypothetical protein [Jannaschia aquimarina]|nr:hypothetical protein [Jannaschia aquimarina]